MRRYHGSSLRPFINGLLLAALPVAAFYGADYLFAPPASEKISSAMDGAGIEHPARVTLHVAGQSHPVAGGVKRSDAEANAEVAADTPFRSVASSFDSGSGKSGLVASIQQELQRVGCYSGALDGTWNERTRIAMAAFNSNVHVNLPTRSPDYILLTLLQGHSSRACARSCDQSTGSVSACVNPITEARTAPASIPSQPAATSALAQGTRAATVVVAAPVAKAANFTEAGERTPSASVEVRTTGESSAPLPGRMAIGAIAEPPQDATAPEVIVPPPHSDIRRGVPTRVRAAGSGSSGRPRSPFAELNLNSP